MLIKVHFGQYGEIESITQKTDMATERSRGFCFIGYKTTDGLEKAVAQAEHSIQNKKVAVQKAQAKQGKVYIDKLPADLSDEIQMDVEYDYHNTSMNTVVEFS